MKRSFFLLGIAVLFWIFCSEYNPFENPTNVNMEIVADKSSIHADSSLSVFTTESLTVIATVRENIDSFTLSAEGNRYWEDTTVAAPIAAGEYTFRFSYPDTGDIKITLITYRKNGDVIPLEFSLNVSSPLAQNGITVEGGTPLTLSTPAVGDNDVMYNWKFQKQDGQPLVLSYPFSSNNTQITDVLSGNTGYLWVEDSIGNKSPEVLFTYSYIDTTGPVIICINQGKTGDTIVTGASSFVFKVECNDNLGIGGALVNSTLFSDSTVNIKSTVYYKTFTNMDTLSTYFVAAVKAWDTDNNESTKTFYIRYDINGPKEIILIKNPPYSPYTTDKVYYDIIADITNPEDDSVTVTIHHVETGSTVSLDTLAPNAEKTVTYTASLQLGSNTLEIAVLDTGNSVIAKDTAKLDYISGNVDKVPPFINKTMVNGIEGKSHFIPGDVAILELEAFDEHMDSVVINGKLKNEENKYHWKDTLILNGELQYFFILLNDSSSNYTNDTVFVMRNYLPLITPAVTWPRTLILGKPWSQTFSVYDADGDSVYIAHVPEVGSTLPDSGSITFTPMGQRRWNARWSGKVSNPGQSVNKYHETYIALVDGKQYNAYPWNFTIKDSTQAKAYQFYIFLPIEVDTTAEGVLDLSTITQAANILCIVVADAKPFSDDDIIAVVQEDKILSFGTDAVDTNWFLLTFIPEEKQGTESMAIMVIDSAGVETNVDTLHVIYSYGFPDDIDSLGFLLRSDTGTVEEEGYLVDWQGLSIKVSENSYTNDKYDTLTMPKLLPGIIQGYPSAYFTPRHHSNLFGKNERWAQGSFTLFFIARQGPSPGADTGNILISAGAESFFGFGVFKGRMGISGQILNSSGIVADTTLTCDLRITNNHWHILCYALNNNPISDQVKVSMWLDGDPGVNNTVTFPAINQGVDLNHMMLGGGGKSVAAKPWRGDIVEVVKYSKYLNEHEMDAVFKYLSSKYKIKLSD
jgi:hypothetical protein